MLKQTKELLSAMEKPETYDEPVKYIKLIQTHISWVFLTGNFVYKIKKPVDFGFLDFSTLEKRKKFCKKEVEINRLFSPEIYIGVFPVNKFGYNIKINGPGETIEYVVKMKELPQDRIMSILLDKDEIDTKIMDKLLDKLLEFYSKTKTLTDPFSPGSLETVKYNWKMNFRTVEKYIGRMIDEQTFEFVKGRVENFMKENKDLFSQRLMKGFVKWCHGDLHSGNIFVVDDKIYIFDAIEFNENFACSDVANDIAFLLMDLEFRHRRFLSDYFLKRYIEKTGDEDVKRLLDFYKCYRAYVRGKVNGLKIDDPSVPDFEKKESQDIARLYFQKALEYAKTF